MSPLTACPDRSALERLLAGSPPEPASDALFAHIESCPACAGTLHQLGHSDTLPDLIRTGVALEATAPTGVEPLVRRILSRPAEPGETVTSPTQAAGEGEAADVLAVLSPPTGEGEIGRLGGYRVLALLGHGGMGAVFQAEDPKLGRLVALKVMLPGVARKPGMKDRFLREARAAAALEHDHVVPVYEVNEANGVPYIAMPFLKGGTLADRLTDTDGPRPVAEVLAVGRQIAAGLAAAHARGLVHRDIKPANVWLDATAGGRVKILDFGLARSDADQNLTHSGSVLGTPSYMAPEQARGQAVDGRADLFSLGVVLYRMTTGRLPFRGDSILAVLSALANDTPPPVRELNPQVPPPLADLIHRLLAKKPADRPASAERVIAELDAVRPTEPRTERKKRPWLPVAVAAAVLALAGISFGIYKLQFETKDGTLVVEVADEDADVRFRQGKLEVWADGKLKYTLSPSEKNKALPPGKYLLKVVGADGVKLETTEFELTKDGKQTVRVTAEPAKVAAADPPKAAADGLPDFPGRTVFRDAFDSGEKCLLPLADGPPKREVKNGKYVVSAADAKAGDVLMSDIGPKVAAGVFAANVRRENGSLFVTFRGRDSDTGTKSRWLVLQVAPTGEWSVAFCRQDVKNNKVVSEPPKEVASGPADPALVAGKWIAVMLRWTETEYEVMLNSKRVAGGAITQPELAGGTPFPIQLAAQVADDGAAKIELDYAAVWDQTALPKPAGGEPDFHSETTFPGKLVFRDTFDSAEKCKLPLADGPPVKKEVTDGKYVVSNAAAKPSDFLTAEIGPRVKVGAFAMRARAEGGVLFVNFRDRTVRESNLRWHTVSFPPAGETVNSVRRNWDKTRWGEASHSVLQSAPPDPKLATGQWVTVAARWSETDFEVWVNGRRVAGGAADPAEVTTTTSPVQVCVRTTAAGPAKLELEFASVWDQTGLPVSAVGPTPTAGSGKTVEWLVSKRKPGTGAGVVLDVGGRTVRLAAGTRPPDGEFTVTAVDLHRMYSEEIFDDDLKRIGALTGLKKLNIGAQSVTAAGLKHLKGLTELTELDIWGQSPEAAGELVRGFDKLEILCLPGDHADEWVAALAGMKKLRFLYCTHGKLTAKGVAGFRNLPALTGITLAKMEDRLDGFLPELAKNDRLRSISFDVVGDAAKAKIDEFAKRVPACEIRYTHQGKEVVLPAGRK